MSQNSFFGFDNQVDLEAEKRRFLQGGGQNEDIAVYTWGDDSYDGLGDALQEGGDELNDETFGGTGAVGGFQFDSCSFGGLLAVEWLIGGCFGFRKGF